MSKRASKMPSGTYRIDYVRFSDSHVKVNLSKFLSTEAGRKLVKDAVVIKCRNEPVKGDTPQPRAKKLVDKALDTRKGEKEVA